MVYRSRKKVNELRKKKSFSNWQKGLQGVSQAARRWGKQAVLCDPGWWLVIDGCLRRSDDWETAAVCLALSSVFLPPQQSDFQNTRKDGKHLFTKHINLRTLGTDLSLFITRTDLTYVPWSPGIHPTLGRTVQVHHYTLVVLVWPSESSSSPRGFAFKLQHWLWPEKVSQKGSQLSLGTEDTGWIISRAKRWEVSSSSALPWSSSLSLIYLALG